MSLSLPRLESGGMKLIAQVVSAGTGVMLDSDRDNGLDHFSVELAALET